MVGGVLGIAAMVVVGARLIDRLSEAAHKVELTELQLLSADRAAKVADISRLLAVASSTDEVAFIVNRAVAAPFGANGASIGLIDRSASVLRIIHGPTVPETARSGVADPPLSAHGAFTDAARDGEVVLLENLATYLSRYPEADPARQRLGNGARAALPMKDRTGTCFGAVALSWEHPTVFDEQTRSTLETVVRLISQTLERTRLSDTVALEADRNRELSRTAEALGTATNVQRVVDVLQDRLTLSLDARFVTLGILDPLAGVVRRYLPHIVDPRLAERYAFESIAAHRPLIDAAREGRQVLIGGIDDLRARYPELTDEDDRVALTAVVNLPLRDVMGRSVGALAVAWDDPDQMDDARLSTVATIAQMTGQTVERVRLAEAEHRVVKNLQERILRPMPDLAGFELAARYRPASAELGMGGDWFEGIELDLDGDPRLAVVVGDVVGHGIDAISDMTYLRSALATLLRTGAPIEDLFTAVADAVDPIEVTATALAVILRADESEVEMLSAGHPPPILIAPDGTSEVLEVGRQPLIGVAPTGHVEAAHIRIEPGGTLALYTDGLVEERRRSIDDGISRVAQLLGETRALTVEEQVDAVLAARVAEGRSEDDIALVLIRRVL
jgi:serine phosphatase RsbU (regulator of sigma subunit)